MSGARATGAAPGLLDPGGVLGEILAAKVGEVAAAKVERPEAVRSRLRTCEALFSG